MSKVRLGFGPNLLCSWHKSSICDKDNPDSRVLLAKEETLNN